MKSPALLLAPLAACGLLWACGYTPLYEPATGAANAAQYLQIGDVTMQQVDNNVGERRVAQTVAQRLKLYFPNVGAGMDTAAVTISQTTSTLAVQPTATVSRAQINLIAYLNLANAEGKPLVAARLTSTAPYNVENTPYSTESGKTFAQLTAARNLADEISRRLYLYYHIHGNSGVPDASVTSATTPAPQGSHPFVMQPSGSMYDFNQ